MTLLDGLLILGVIVAGVLALTALSVLGRKVQRKRMEMAADTPLRTQTHEAQVRAVLEWLTDEKIVRTLIDQRVGTHKGLESTLAAVEHMDEGEVAATVALMLRNRTVRRVISHYEAPRRDLNRAEVMECLAEWAEAPLVRKEVML